METAKDEVIRLLTKEGLVLQVQREFIQYRRIQLSFWDYEDGFGASIMPNPQLSLCQT